MPGASVIDVLQNTLPARLRWILAGMGGAAGFAWAQQHGSSVPASCVVAGTAIGFCFVVALFVGLRLVKAVLLCAVALLVLNYTVLVPFGYGDHSGAWLAMAEHSSSVVLDALTHLVDRWQAGMQ